MGGTGDGVGAAGDGTGATGDGFRAGDAGGGVLGPGAPMYHGSRPSPTPG